MLSEIDLQCVVYTRYIHYKSGITVFFKEAIV